MDEITNEVTNEVNNVLNYIALLDKLSSNEKAGKPHELWVGRKTIMDLERELRILLALVQSTRMKLNPA